MTPTAVTPAARRARPNTGPPGSGSRSQATGRPSSLRSTTAPPPRSQTQRPQSLRSARPGRERPAAAAKPTAARKPTAAARKPTAARKPAAAPTSKATSKRPPQRASSARSAGHRASVRASPAPRARRRVSGPAGGIASLAVAGGYGSVALPAPTRTRRRVRPTAPARPSITLPRPRLPHVELPSPGVLAHGAAAFVASLPESSLLDRVIRGRIWIPLLGVLLVGIVGMQVENLKLNAGLGTAIEQTTILQSRNDWLRSDVAQLSDPQRIEGIAARHGMLMGPPSATKFLAPGNSTSVGAAIAGIHAPGSTYFVGPVATSSAAAAAAAPGSTTAPAAAG